MALEQRLHAHAAAAAELAAAAAAAEHHHRRALDEAAAVVQALLAAPQCPHATARAQQWLLRHRALAHRNDDTALEQEQTDQADEEDDGEEKEKDNEIKDKANKETEKDEEVEQPSGTTKRTQPWPSPDEHLAACKLQVRFPCASLSPLPLLSGLAAVVTVDGLQQRCWRRQRAKRRMAAATAGPIPNEVEERAVRLRNRAERECVETETSYVAFLQLLYRVRPCAGASCSVRTPTTWPCIAVLLCAAAEAR